MIRHSWIGYALLSGALLVLMSEVCGELVSVKDEEPCVEQQEEERQDEMDENVPESEPEELPEIEAIVGGHRMIESDEPPQEVQMSVGNAASVVVTDEYQIYTDGDKVEYLPLP